MTKIPKQSFGTSAMFFAILLGLSFMMTSSARAGQCAEEVHDIGPVPELDCAIKRSLRRAIGAEAASLFAVQIQSVTFSVDEESRPQTKLFVVLVDASKEPLVGKSAANLLGGNIKEFSVALRQNFCSIEGLADFATKNAVARLEIGFDQDGDFNILRFSTEKCGGN